MKKQFESRLSLITKVSKKVLLASLRKFNLHQFEQRQNKEKEKNQLRLQIICVTDSSGLNSDTNKTFFGSVTILGVQRRWDD